MGANQSGGISIGGSSMGYQVLRVYPNSPGSEAGLKAYFDFIVAIGNTRFDKEDGSLREILKASVDQKLKMVVYNTRSKTAREVDVVPTTRWGGSGLLGVSIKHSSFDRAEERVWHVVQVDPGSPAHQAGFKANEDYVIGSDSVLQENDDLYNLIEAHEGRALKLFVYNTKTDNCREVICHPNSKWGGRGYLGCEFGHGLLHRIPCGDYQGADDPRRPLVSPQQYQQQHDEQHQQHQQQQQQQQHQQQQQQQQQPPLQHQHQQPQHHQQPAAQQPRPQTFAAATFQSQAMLQQSQRNQPGYQLLQQALFDKSPSQQQPPLSSNNSQSIDRLPPPPQHNQLTAQHQALPPQVPQTFAQLGDYQNASDSKPPLISPQQYQPQQVEQQQQLQFQPPLQQQQQQQHYEPQQQQQHYEQQPAPQQPSVQTFSPSTFQSPATLQQPQHNQPGYQLPQQALFDQYSAPTQPPPLSNNSQQIDRLPPPSQHSEPAEQQQLQLQSQQAAPPQVPQTFAQLASAQYQISPN